MEHPIAPSTPEETPLFRLEGAGRSFDGHRALAATDLDIPPGGRTALIGPSGCGKSTLLKLLSGLVAPDRGRVLCKGADLAGLDLLAHRRRLGHVSQQGGLFPHLTAAANVTLMAPWLGLDAAAARDRLAELAALVRLPAERLARYPAELSGGQRQRVGLMRALFGKPEMLLLDEPLGALDPMIRFRLQEDLKEIFDRLGTTVLLVTHDLAEARWLADRIVLMQDGGIVQQGSFADLLEHPANDFVRAFVRAQRGLALDGAAS